MFSEFKEVLKFNFNQVASHQEELPIDTDWDMYFKFEEMNMVHITTLRDKGRLIGYMSFITAPSHNFKGLTFAYTDKYVVLKEYWGRGLGKQLVQKTLDWATELGCKKISGTAKISQGPAPLKMYEDLGFEKVEIALEKLLNV